MIEIGGKDEKALEKNSCLDFSFFAVEFSDTCVGNGNGKHNGNGLIEGGSV